MPTCDQEPKNAASGWSAAPLRVFLVLLFLFVGSGCAALIYEIVWLQLLQLVIGSTAHSLGVLLGTFMGGMCLGSIGFARLVSARRHPLRVYAALELGIAAIGLALLYILPYVGRLYAASAAGGTYGVLLRAGVSALCLLPPTVLMGATLPAIARWVETTPKGVSRLGFFYGANIAGAVFGCLLSGFYLLRVYDAAVATYVAVAVNVAIGLTGLLLASAVGYRVPTCERADKLPSAGPTKRSVYAAIGLSGMTALGAEVIWTRLLSLQLGATVYTFSIILAVFLFGLGVGSSVGSLLAQSGVSARAALGGCQVLLTAAIAWTAYAVTQLLPYWPVDVTLTPTPWIGFQLDLMRCVWAMLPAACLWGASFPLALAAAASPGQDPGRLVGGVYAANTVGAIAGSLLFSMLMIPWFGTQHAHQVLIGVSAAAALLMLAPLVWEGSRSESAGLTDRLVGSLGVVATLSLAGVLSWSVPQVPPGLIAYGRNLPTYLELPEFLYAAEGMNASIAVSEESDGARNFHVSGKVVASSLPQDMRLQRMMCHIPGLIHPGPKSVLIVGCGAGVTAGTFVVYPEIERIVVCEIEPLIPPAAGEYFSVENYDFLKDPRVDVVYDDARHHLAASREKFDIITSDPIHPWVKGAAALYSEEYFDLCKRHLNPGGVIAQWVPLYETNEEAVNSQIATFMQAFPDGTIWSNDSYGEGYDTVLLGQIGPTKIDVAALQSRLDREDYRRVKASLQDVEFDSALALVETYAGQGRDLARWLDLRNINRDNNLRLQYLAGLSPNSYLSDSIYRSIVKYRRYPDNLFIASGAVDDELKEFFDTPGSE